MKKLLAHLFILFSGICSAQNFDAGLMGGFTTSQVSGDQLGGYHKLGARMGAYISYPLQKKMNLQVEMQYIQKGSKKPFIKNSPQTYSFNLHYIEVPLTMNYQIKKGIYLEGGIGTAYLFACKEQDEYGDINADKPNTLAFDLLLGAQYQFKKNVKFNLRFGNSLIPFRKHSSGGERGLNKGQYSTMISLALMYQINR